MKKLKLFVDRIEALEDQNHCLMIENDLLKNEIAELIAEMTEKIKKAA